MSETPPTLPLSAYPYRLDIQTRFGDNDMLGHVNNVAFNRFIEAVVTRFQMLEAGVDWARDKVSPVAVETLCRFHRPLSFPETVRAGLRVQRIGTSSVTLAFALFSETDGEAPAATGHFVHVFTDRASNAVSPIPGAVRAVYEKFQ